MEIKKKIDGRNFTTFVCCMLIGIQKTKIMAFSLIPSLQIDGEKQKQ